MESWPKVKLGSHYVLLLGFIYSYFAPDTPFWSRYFALFIYICQYLALYTYIYPLLAFFAPIWLYLPLIALIWPYMPYSPYIYILIVRLCRCAKF